MSVVRINVGCGMSPTPGWVNIDNSPSVRLAGLPRLTSTLDKLNVLPQGSKRYIEWCKSNDVRYGTALDLPVSDNSVDVIYTSHMVEHLDKATAQAFLAEALRALKPDGIIRIAVPDLERFVDMYKADGDADAFIGSLLMSQPMAHTWQDRARTWSLGFRDHRWMYDRNSLAKLLAEAGFVDVKIQEPGATEIADPGELDLYERADESIYAEGRAPISLSH